MATRLVSYFTNLISFPFVTLILKDSTTSTFVHCLSYCLVVPSIHGLIDGEVLLIAFVTYVVWNVWNGFP